MDKYKLTKEEEEYFYKIANPIINSLDFQKQKDFIQHGHTSTYEHALNVALSCYKYALRKKKYHLEDLIKGALLHDLCLYDWHKLGGRKRFHGIRHPKIALDNALKNFELSKITKNMIRAHMWPLTIFHFPKYKESGLLWRMDKKQSYIEMRRK